MKKIFSSPITHFNLLVIGSFIAIQSLHLHAHYKMDTDTDSYVRGFLRKNPTYCK